ncbi:hypothetical protein HHK36_011493 [Tetracentron sinense]|uniref:Glutaredoxin domain-containing protein n=1 Tax=Tetracentron sinense TaxID=13715 RepID=A0A834ZBV8_TETSI|nr:hypothetical protein HHK36_011493 [Tetracentron sinense]
MKGRFMKKLKSFRPIVSLKQARVLQVNASDGFPYPFPTDSNRIAQDQSILKEQGQKADYSNLPAQEPDIIDISELMRDLEEEEMEFHDDIGNKENIKPPTKFKEPVSVKGNSETPILAEFHEPEPQLSESASPNLWQGPLSEIDISSFRRPDLNSGTLFDPNLLAAFEQVVMNYIRNHEVERKVRVEKLNLEKDEEPPSKARRMEDKPLLDFEEMRPAFEIENHEAERKTRIEEEDIEKIEEPLLMEDKPLLDFEEMCPAFEIENHEAERKTRIEEEDLEKIEEPPLMEDKPLLVFEEMCPVFEIENHEAERKIRIEEEDLEKIEELPLMEDKPLLDFEEMCPAFEIENHEAERKTRIEEENLENDEEPPLKARRMEENPLLEFEEKCPPGGSESVILYTTSLRGIRKTFEDCSSIRFLLGSFRILYYERDVSMHLEFREELWKILGCRVVPPRLFIKGRYIGGADKVVGLHEQGKLRKLFQGVPLDPSDERCDGCAGIRFVLCFNCSGSCKVILDGGDDGSSIRCPECNENGLIICPICC